ncbi:SH3 domain-containing protein [Sediminispirochaeta bajacaliforniensis]|uniref:SH3 domain-containing protein n=1 Tax=Sediminispirochaeta bajacaliforniensis TaxID=148 RepID=UPI00036C72BA|nr:SH3 domain-containing protein [Sediminispirochaeta bajacaliforniensis]
MRKYLFILFLTASALSSLSSRDWDIQYECIRETYAYDDTVGNDVVFSLPKGSILNSNGRWSGYPARFCFFQEGKEYWVPAIDIKPVESDTLPEIFTEDLGSHWITSYVLSALYVSKPREFLYQYEPYWRDDYNAQGQFDWWNSWNPNILDSYNSLLKFYSVTFGFTKLLVTRITKADNSMYTIDAIVTDVDVPSRQKSNPIFSELENQEVKLILEFDGDYLDIYLNDTSTHFAQLVRIDKDLEDAIIQKMKLEPVDLSGLHWPTRADGSMHYPKIPADLTDFSPTHTTTANLRLRIQPDTSAGFFTTLPEGTKVQVTEEGETETIDGITAPWLEVISESGYKGWCFGGYLAEMATEKPEDSRQEPVTSEDEASSNSTMNQLQPSWLLSVVGAGVLLVIVAVIVVILRKRK